MKIKKTKLALVSSVVSIILCISMLLGTTYAWFTDSVSSASNVIVAGNLDADVYYGDPADKNSVASVNTLFNEVELWEPGAAAYENITIANVGSLALKYKMTVAFTNENYIIDGEKQYKLSDVLKVGLVDGAIPEGTSRENAIAMVSQWKPMTDFSLLDSLEAFTNEDTVGMLIYWEPSDEDNNYNVQNGKVSSDGEALHVDLGITLVATQETFEEDSFNKNYDKDAEFPIVASGTVNADTMESVEITAGPVTVKVPKTAPYGTYTLELTSFETQKNEDDTTVIDTNFELKKDGSKVAADAAEYEVIIQAEYMSGINALYHYDEEIVDYEYDVYTGKISFKTDSFSPFSIDYTVFGKEVAFEELDNGSYRITRGFFRGVNPALGSVELGLPADPTLLGDDSEYIAVDCVKDGVKCYAVSKRATTIILDDGAENEYVFENGDYSDLVVTNASGSIWKIVTTDMTKNILGFVPETVYILPGTYKESTTAYVRASMDIVGIGNAADINVIKQSSSNSNRHLFDVTGESADYIQVTIRNMTLDATANTTGGKDNAAVQSIRKSKVKCYDLIIVKNPTNMAAIAFYVNGNNPVDGVKYTAYLYTENCVLNSTKSPSVVSTLGKYKFYHTDLTYAGTKYTKNSGSIKNQTLEWNDWDW